jgi:hypothetical protein
MAKRSSTAASAPPYLRPRRANTVRPPSQAAATDRDRADLPVRELQLTFAYVSFFRRMGPPHSKTEQEEGDNEEGQLESSASSVRRNAEELFDEIHVSSRKVGIETDCLRGAHYLRRQFMG